MRIVGLDLSTVRVGMAMANGDLVSVTGKSPDIYRRLSDIRRGVFRELTLRPPRPDLIVVEDYSLGSPGRISLVRLGEIGGIIRSELFERDWRFVLVRPSSVKQFATGKGNADKPAMIAAARALGTRATINDDEADAFHLRRMAQAAYGLLDRPLETHEISALDGCGVEW